MNSDPSPPHRHPPRATRNVFGDVGAFLLRRPSILTRIGFASREEREDYIFRILQRVDVDVTRYSVLNLHRIGIEAPARYVFEELLSWDGDSSCWPNHIATAERVDGHLEKIRIRPLGFGSRDGKKRWWSIPPLFDLSALRIREVPGESDLDNARYLLYACSGGYPIGIFLIFVRSPIAERGETEQAQVYFGVGFDFYGRERGWLFGPLNRTWERVHDRVTANVLNRFKQLCEWRFERTQAGR